MVYTLVFILGGLGTLLRWGVGSYLNTGEFPWGTLTVNILGCLAIGYIFSQAPQPMPDWATVLMVGFLGAFTTFSAYSMDSIYLIKGGQWLTAGFYILLSNGLGLLACWLGWKGGGG